MYSSGDDKLLVEHHQIQNKYSRRRLNIIFFKVSIAVTKVVVVVVVATTSAELSCQFHQMGVDCRVRTLLLMMTTTTKKKKTAMATHYFSLLLAKMDSNNLRRSHYGYKLGLVACVLHSEQVAVD